jgi:hypothetical protein
MHCVGSRLSKVLGKLQESPRYARPKRKKARRRYFFISLPQARNESSEKVAVNFGMITQEA